MSHDEMKAIIEEWRAERQKGLKSMQRKSAPKPRSRKTVRLTQGSCGYENHDIIETAGELRHDTDKAYLLFDGD